MLADVGIEFDAAEPSEAELGEEQVRLFLREAMPRLEERDVPVLLPASWLRSPSARPGQPDGDERAAVRVERAALAERAGAVRLAARGRRHRAHGRGARRARRREGAVRPHRRPLARSSPLGGREGAALPRPPPRRRRHRRPRPRGLRARDRRGGRRARRGLARRVARRPCSRAGERRFRALPTPAAMTHPLFPFQERGHGWLRLLGDLGVGAILADDMGLGKTVQAIAMLASEREDAGDEKLGPTLVVCPMSVVKQWGARDPPLRALAARAPPPRPQPPRRPRARARGAGPRRRRHLLRHRDPGRRRARGDRLGPAAPRRGAGREEPGDEARARSPPAAGAPQGRDDRHADREPARRALGDHGHRQPGPARLARGVRPRLRAADRAVRRRGVRWSGCARSSIRSSSAARRTRPRSSSSCPRSRSRRTTAA